LQIPIVIVKTDDQDLLFKISNIGINFKILLSYLPFLAHVVVSKFLTNHSNFSLATFLHLVIVTQSLIFHSLSITLQFQASFSLEHLLIKL